MVAPSDITVVFVPGAFHSPDGYDGVISHLHAAGYNTSKVFTPSVVRNGGPIIQSIDPDVEEIRKHLTAATDAGQKVVLVMHSYGGHPGSQALKGFDQATFASQGHTDGRGVIHLLYLASFMLRHGESIVAAVKEPSNYAEMREDGTAFPINPAHIYSYDFESQDEIDRWVAMLNPWSPAGVTAELLYEPWKDVSTTYIACEDDRAIPVAWQKEYVRNAVEAGAVDMRVISWKCGHTPFGVRPLEVSHVIRSAVGDVPTS